LEENKRFSVKSFPVEDMTSVERESCSEKEVEPCQEAVFQGGSPAQREEMKEVYRAAYHYVKLAILDAKNSPERVKTWFGKK